MRPKNYLVKVSLTSLAILFSFFTTYSQISFSPTDTILYYGGGYGQNLNRVSYVDINSDDKTDMLTITPFSVIVKKGNGDGTFSDNEILYQQEKEIYSISNLYDINNDGYLDLALINYPYLVVLTGSENGFTVYDEVSFNTSYGVLKWIDFDKDGSVDLISENSTDIVINKNWQNNLSDFHSLYSISYPYQFDIIDINKDNNLDLVVSSSNKFVISFSNSNNEFTDIYETEKSYLPIEYGDINLDSYIDFVFDHSDEIYTLTYNSANNSFYETNITSTEDHYNIGKPELVDLDNNNTLDIIFENRINDLSYLLNSNGVYGNTSDFNLTGLTDIIVNIECLDINDDDQVDIMINGMSNQEVHLLNSDLSIKKTYYYITYPTFHDLSFNDLDNDGFEDIIGLSEYGKIVILWGNENNEYSEMQEVDASLDATYCYIQDFNSDNILDIIYTIESPNNGINKIDIIYGLGDREFSKPTYAKYFPNPNKPFEVDINNDKKNEFLFSNRNGNTISWFNEIDTLNRNEYFSMTNKIELDPTFRISNVISNDWNNDSLTDLVVIEKYSSKILVLLNNSSNNFNVSEINFTEDVYAAQGFKFDNDTIVDLLTVTMNNNNFYLNFLKGNNDGTFEETDSLIIPSINEADYIKILDIDSDMDEDIIIGSWDNYYTVIVENQDSLFNIYNKTEITTINQGPRIYVDINDDNKIDILSAAFKYGNIIAQYNNSIIKPEISNMNLEVSNITNNSLSLKIHQEELTKKIVLIREDTLKSLSEKPKDNVFYTSNSNYGIGSELDNAFIIYIGTDTIINVTGLQNVTDYSLFVFEYTQNEPNNNLILYTDSCITIDTTTGNGTPYFESVSLEDATVGITYNFTIVAEDEDTNDTLVIEDISLPSWLSLIDNGDRTASLSGTPSIDDIGEQNIILGLSDKHIESPIEQSFTINIKENTANFVEDLSGNITIYPNPATNFLTFENNFLEENKHIRIYSLDGTVKLETKIKSNTINISSLESGAYIIEVILSNKRYTSNFLKK